MHLFTSEHLAVQAIIPTRDKERFSIPVTGIEWVTMKASF